MGRLLNHCLVNADQLGRHFAQQFIAGFRYDKVLLQAHGASGGSSQGRLHGHNHASLQRRILTGLQARILVDIQANAVADPPLSLVN